MSQPVPVWMRHRFVETDSDIHYPACQGGPCKQGRGICPTPIECQVPEYEEPVPRSRAGTWIVIGLLVAFWMGVFAWLK